MPQVPNNGQDFTRRTGVFWACKEACYCLGNLRVVGTSTQRTLTAVALAEAVKDWVLAQLLHVPTEISTGIMVHNERQGSKQKRGDLFRYDFTLVQSCCRCRNFEQLCQESSGDWRADDGNLTRSPSYQRDKYGAFLCKCML